MSESLYFVGGTALRFLYRIRRYSENLDFTAGKAWGDSSIQLFNQKMDRELKIAGYDADVVLKDTKTVQRLMIRFPDLLYELGLSGREDKKFSIHIEIDQNPPLGWVEERTVVNIHMPVLIRHYDLPSAFAGKLAAILLRPYTKGRDIFDFFWFRSRWHGLVPNLRLLNNALNQQGSKLGPLKKNTWLAAVGNKMESLDWADVAADVRPFLESEDDLTAFTQNALMTLLK